jgi:hypothetical protein
MKIACHEALRLLKMGAAEKRMRKKQLVCPIAATPGTCVGWCRTGRRVRRKWDNRSLLNLFRMKSRPKMRLGKLSLDGSDAFSPRDEREFFMVRSVQAV